MYYSICQALKKRTTLDICRLVKAGHYSCPYLSFVFSILICIHVYMYTSSFMVQNYILCHILWIKTLFASRFIVVFSLRFENIQCIYCSCTQHNQNTGFENSSQIYFFSVYITQIPISLCKCSVTFNLV